MSRFYVYAYLRSKDSENGLTGSPYYIGKGTGRRMFEKHIVNKPADKSNIVILHDNINNEDACAKEIELIAYYGRIDKGTGILRNLTDGGESGCTGRIVTESQRIKSSIANKGLKRSEKSIANIKAGLAELDFSGENNHFFGLSHTAESKKKMSDAKKGKTFDQIYGKDVAADKKKKVSEKLRGRTFTNESLEKMRQPKGPQKRVVCPHCNKIGGASNMKRWHFDNCKSINR